MKRTESRALAALLALAAVAGSGPAAMAGEAATGTLALPAAVELALRSSPLVLQAQAQQEQAAAGRREAGAMRLPHLQVREVALRTDSPADAFGLQLMQERF
ncbi:hypothetical protein FJ250_02310, partial [bacterium]|nr:hypothetical protein [bacterium]